MRSGKLLSNQIKNISMAKVRFNVEHNQLTGVAHIEILKPGEKGKEKTFVRTEHYNRQHNKGKK